jgi:hypothetical protein
MIMTMQQREAAINYDAAVAEATRLVKVLQSNQRQLGALADQLVQILDLMRSFAVHAAVEVQND